MTSEETTHHIARLEARITALETVVKPIAERWKTWLEINGPHPTELGGHGRHDGYDMCLATWEFEESHRLIYGNEAEDTYV